MRSLLTTLALGALLATPVFAGTPGLGPMVRYSNAAGGYSIDYPERQMTPQPGSPSTPDQVRIAAPRGQQVLLWGGQNVLRQTAESFADEAERLCDGGHADRRSVRPTLVEVSCLERRDGILYVFHQRTVIRGDRAVTARFTYPSDRRQTWDRIVPVMAPTLTLR